MLDSSPAACRFAIRDKTVFCFLLSGLLNIDSALTLISFAGRDDADGFFFAIFILHAMYVDDQQQRSLLQWHVRQPRCDPCGTLLGDRRKRMPQGSHRGWRSLRNIAWGSSKTNAAISNAMPPC